jgi:protein farnesyltransferase/geranylgeranyltransferase type-1 subunit alpha
VELYVDEVDNEDADRMVDLENPPPSEGAQLPCPAAIEFMADVHEASGKEGISEAVKVRPFLTRADVFIPYSPMPCIVLCCQLWRSLAHTHDSVRKRYVVDLRRRRPSNKPVTRTDIGNSAFETQSRTLVGPESHND